MPSTIASAAPGPPAVPAWVDPAYVGTLIHIAADGWPQRWEGGPFHHCADASLDPEQRAYVAYVGRVMTDVSGIPQTTVGPCNVEWSIDDGHVVAVGAPGARAVTELRGGGHVITAAHVYFFHYAVFDSAEHEAGHALGLGHSPKRTDCMFASGGPDEFSTDERAVLRWLYTS